MGMQIGDNITSGVFTRKDLINYLNTVGFSQYNLAQQSFDTVLGHFRAYLFVKAFPEEYYSVFEDPLAAQSVNPYDPANWTYSAFRGFDNFNEVLSNPPPGRDWAAMPDALQRLANLPLYKLVADPLTAFVHDVGFLFAGIESRFENSLPQALANAARGVVHTWRNPKAPPNQQVQALHAHLRPSGLDTQDYYDWGSYDPGNVHHWATAFALGYAFGQAGAIAADWRERFPGGTQADINMGWAGANMGMSLRDYGLDRVRDLTQDKMPYARF
jgi:hypothetical protein